MPSVESNQSSYGGNDSEQPSELTRLQLAELTDGMACAEGHIVDDWHSVPLSSRAAVNSDAWANEQGFKSQYWPSPATISSTKKGRRPESHSGQWCRPGRELVATSSSDIDLSRTMLFTPTI